jgi:ActR/RegA family two-component response regulator
MPHPLLARIVHHERCPADHADPESVVFDAAHSLPAVEERFPVLLVSACGPDLRRLARILEAGALEVQSAPGLSQALALIKRRHFPVVVIDCEMGEGCWRERWRQIQLASASPLPRIIVFSC